MTSSQTLLFYIVLFFISTLFVYLGSRYRLPKQLRWFFVCIGILIPTLIGGMRGETVGTDTPEYIRMYSDILANQFSLPIEPVTTVIATVSGSITSSSWLFLSIFALITTVFYYLAIVKIDRKYLWFMWFIYLFVYFTFSFNIMRQMAAVSILFYAIVQLTSGNKRLFILWSVVAVSTHAVSAVAAVIYYFFYRINARKSLSRGNIIFAALFVAVFLGVLASNLERIVAIVPIPIFQKVLDNALYGEASLSIANSLFYLAVASLMIVLYRQIQQRSGGMTIFAAGMAIGSVLVFLDGYLAHAGRIAYFFVVPALPVIIYAIVMQANRLRNVAIFAVMVASVLIFIATRYLGDGSDVIPYYIHTMAGGLL